MIVLDGLPSAAERWCLLGTMTMDVPPTIVAIFGGTGDLAWRKLVPSLFDLHQDGRMPEAFAIIAVGRHSVRDATLRQRLFAFRTRSGVGS